MKKLLVTTTLVAAAMLFGFCASVSAQVDHWATSDECIAAQGAPYYYPILVHQQMSTNAEVAQGRPTPSCINMDLPDRLGGHGWVRVGDDRKIIYSKTTGKPLRLAECNNRIYGIVALPAVQARDGKDGAPGISGAPGQPGRDGFPGQNGYDGRDANCNCPPNQQVAGYPIPPENYPPNYGYPQQAGYPSDGYGGYPQPQIGLSFEIPIGGYGNNGQAYTGNGRGRSGNNQRQQQYRQPPQRGGGGGSYRQPQRGGNGGGNYRQPQHGGGNRVGGNRGGGGGRTSGVGPGARTGGYR